MLQCVVAVFCSVLQCVVAVCQMWHVQWRPCGAAWCSVFNCVAVCCSVLLQCDVAVSKEARAVHPLLNAPAYMSGGQVV